VTTARAIATRVFAEPFQPPAWLRGPHVQTIAAALLPRAAVPAGTSWFVRTDPGTYVRCRTDRPTDASGTTLVVVHGLGGSSESGHAVDLVRPALARGIEVVRMNMRNCGGTEHLTPTLYHSNQQQDLRAVVERLIEKRRARRIVLAGYSVGGNLVLNALAAWGSRAPAELARAIVLCPAIDVGACVRRVDETSFLPYRKYFVGLLRRFYERKAALYPDRFDRRRLSKVRTLRDFDTVATAPDSGFADVDAFHSWVSSASRLGLVRVPTIVVHAADDPIVTVSAGTRRAIEANDVMAFTEIERGGHCGFVDGARRWMAERVVAAAA
jgi:predicted alpha/beta-fold hydrolase